MNVRGCSAPRACAAARRHVTCKQARSVAPGSKSLCRGRFEAGELCAGGDAKRWRSLQGRLCPGPTRCRAGTPGARFGADQDGGSGRDVGGKANASKTPSDFAMRTIAGCIMGGVGAFAVLSGGYIYMALVTLLAWQVSREYWSFVCSEETARGHEAPPPALPLAASAISALTCIATCFLGRPSFVLAVGVFALLVIQVVASEKPTLREFAMSSFGVLYSGFLPAFWIKLRFLALPATSASGLAQAWPTWLGGPTQVTVGLLATLMACLAVVAADTGAFLVGRTIGKTQLIKISPKKTVEGAVGGLLAATGVTSALACMWSWPTPVAVGSLVGIVCFFTSLFGDLIESTMKRGAGMKDSGALIPGHGGVLDRFDSYIFTGALVYFSVVYGLPFFGL